MDVYDCTKHKNDDDVLICTEAREFLKSECLDKDNFIDTVIVKTFCITLVEYMKNKFPLTDRTLNEVR